MNRLTCCAIAATISTLALIHQSVASADDDVMQVLSATYKVVNSSSTATAFIVDRKTESGESELILLTAAHVIEAMSGDKCKIVLRKRTDDGGYKRVESTIEIRERGHQLWVKHPKADVAAMRIQLPPDHEVKPLPFHRILDTSQCDNCEIQLGEEAWIFTYPNQLESSSSGFPVLRSGSVASFPLRATEKTRSFMVDYTASAGDSGGPVFVRRRDIKGKSQPYIVGLVHGQHRETVKSKTPNEERIVHRPMGLSIVVHAKFIRETVDLIE